MEIKSRKDREELAKHLCDWIEDVEKSKDSIDNIALELYKNYNSIRSKRFYNGDSDIFVPFSFMMVETMVAKLTTRIFGDFTPVPISGLGPDDKNQEAKIRALLHMQQKSQVNLKAKITEYIRARCIFPRAYAKVFWRTSYRKIKRPKVVEQEVEFDPIGGMDAQEEETPTVIEGAFPKTSFSKVTAEEVEVPDYDCWDIQNLDFFDVGVDPMAPNGDIQRAKFSYVRSLVTDNELKVLADMKDADGEPMYKMLKTDIEGSGDGEFQEDIIDKKEMIGLDIRNLEVLKNNGDRHELHEIYYHYDIDDDGVVEKDCLFYLLDRKVLIRAEKNPWWHGMKPYISGSHFPRPNEFMGQSLIQPVRKIQYEMNDKRNQELDGTTMTLMPNWFAGDDAAIEDAHLRMTTGGVIRVADINQIKPAITPDLSAVGQRTEALLDANAREAIGVTRSVQGVSETGPRQSATQFSQMLAQAGERIQLTLEEFGTGEWRDLWTMAYSLDQQFLRRPTFLRMTERESLGFDFLGAEGEVNPEDLVLNMDFTVNTFQDQAQKNAQTQNLLQFADIASKLPPSEGNQSFFNMIIRKMWTGFGYGEEELIDDNGQHILLTQPGAASIFDMETQQAGGEGEVPVEPESFAQVEQGGINEGDLAALENAMLGGSGEPTG